MPWRAIESQQMAVPKRNGEVVSPLWRIRAQASAGRVTSRPSVSKKDGRSPRVSRASHGRGFGGETGPGGTVDIFRPPRKPARPGVWTDWQPVENTYEH